MDNQAEEYRQQILTKVPAEEWPNLVLGLRRLQRHSRHFGDFLERNIGIIEQLIEEAEG